MKNISAATCLAALCLTQFHPIAETDDWWTRGLIETTTIYA